MSSNQRKVLLVDRHVQGALLARAIGYCVLNTLFMAAGFALWQWYVASLEPLDAALDSPWIGLACALLASLGTLPLVIFDSLRLTNRFVGPLVRVRRSLRKLARGDKLEQIQFRQGDFWHEFAEELNAAIVRIERDKLAAARSQGAAVPPSLYPIEVD